MRTAPEFALPQTGRRAGLAGSSEDKGYEATSAALVTAMCLKKIHRSYEADEQF